MSYLFQSYHRSQERFHKVPCRLFQHHPQISLQSCQHLCDFQLNFTVRAKSFREIDDCKVFTKVHFPLSSEQLMFHWKWDFRSNSETYYSKIQFKLSQTQEDKYFMIPSITGTDCTQIHSDRNQHGDGQRLGEGKLRNQCLMGTEFLLGKTKSSGDRWQMVAQQRE